MMLVGNGINKIAEANSTSAIHSPRKVRGRRRARVIVLVS